MKRQFCLLLMLVFFALPVHALDVAVTIMPQKEWVEAVGGNRVQVSVFLPQAASESHFEPRSRDLKRLRSATVYFSLGHLPVERNQLPRLKTLNPKLKVVDLSEGLDLLKADPGFEAESGKGGDRVDPHTWLSIPLVKLQVKKIVTTLSDMDPAGKTFYEQNGAVYLNALEELDKMIREDLKPLEGKSFMVYHPTFGYFAHEYGLFQYPIEFEGKDPSAQYLKLLLDTCKRENVNVIFIQKQFDKRLAERIAEQAGIQILELDPMSPNYIENMKSIGSLFRDAL